MGNKKADMESLDKRSVIAFYSGALNEDAAHSSLHRVVHVLSNSEYIDRNEQLDAVNPGKLPFVECPIREQVFYPLQFRIE